MKQCFFKLFKLSMPFILFLVITILFFRAQEGSVFVEKEINQLISSKDPVAIAQVSEFENTKNFLLNLPAGTRAERTSSSQGAKWVINKQGLPVMKVYFVTALSGEKVEVYMYKDTNSKLYYKLFPQWTITSVSL